MAQYATGQCVSFGLVWLTIIWRAYVDALGAGSPELAAVLAGATEAASLAFETVSAAKIAGKRVRCFAPRAFRSADDAPGSAAFPENSQTKSAWLEIALRILARLKQPG